MSRQPTMRDNEARIAGLYRRGLVHLLTGGALWCLGAFVPLPLWGSALLTCAGALVLTSAVATLGEAKGRRESARERVRSAHASYSLGYALGQTDATLGTPGAHRLRRER